MIVSHCIHITTIFDFAVVCDGHVLRLHCWTTQILEVWYVRWERQGFTMYFLKRCWIEWVVAESLHPHVAVMRAIYMNELGQSLAVVEGLWANVIANVAKAYPQNSMYGRQSSAQNIKIEAPQAPGWAWAWPRPGAWGAAILMFWELLCLPYI